MGQGNHIHESSSNNEDFNRASEDDLDRIDDDARHQSDDSSSQDQERYDDFSYIHSDDDEEKPFASWTWRSKSEPEDYTVFGDYSKWREHKGQYVTEDGEYRFVAEERDPDDEEFEFLKRSKKRRLAITKANLNKWQKRRIIISLVLFIAIIGGFLAWACFDIARVPSASQDWDYYMTENSQYTDDLYTYEDTATKVTAAVYISQVQNIDLGSAQFEVTMRVGYRWMNDSTLDFSKPGAITFYKGNISNMELLDDQTYDDGTRYQLVRYNIVISKNFDTRCFPIDDHNLRIYMEPSLTVKKLILEVDTTDSYLNSGVTANGFDVEKFGVAQIPIKFTNNLNNPRYDQESSNEVYKSEVLVQMNIMRQNIGMFLECFIAMYGTLFWIILCIYICAVRKVDPLGMISASFFGAVSNVMVGANLVPNSLSVGLIVYGNMFGIMMIIAGAIIIISINSIRNEYHGRGFAYLYGRIMLTVFVIAAILGNILLPLSTLM